MTPVKRRTLAIPVGTFFVIGLLALLPPAYAQDPIPTSADPSSAEQATTDLVVTVGGDNFGTDSEVEFLVTGTNDPGGITVKNVKRKGPKTLKVTIDVDADAVVDDFDIEVMSRGRTGKGTELFRVMKKTQPGEDTIPPGTVTVEYVGTEYNEVFLRWIAPADDGFDPASGPAFAYWVKCAPGQVIFDSANWTEVEDCGCEPWTVGPPGTYENTRIYSGWGGDTRGFEPATTYSFAVRVQDWAFNLSDISNTVTVTTDPFNVDPGWTVQQVPIPIDAAWGHAFDPSGSPVIVARYQEQIRIIRGTWDAGSGQWGWALEHDFPGTADSFALDPSGVPAFGRLETLNSSRAQVFYTFFNGADWVTELVASANGKERGPVTIAFDPSSGEPVLAYYHWDDRKGGGVTLARRSASGQWTFDVVEAVGGGGGVKGRGIHYANAWVALAFDLAGSPAVAYSLDLDEDQFDHYHDVVMFASLASGTWQVELVDTRAPLPNGFEEGVGDWGELIYDDARDDFAFFQGRSGLYTSEYCERDAGAWLCREAVYGEDPDSDDARWRLMAIDGGEVYIANGIGGSILLERSLDGETWSHEFIWYLGFWPEVLYPPFDFGSSGPFLSLDPAGLPTLSWSWGRDDWPPGGSNLYFAWKGTP